MYIPFEQLSEEARIWVYQASRPFTQQACEQVLGEAQNFLAQWASHGNPLQGSATILHNQFLILAVFALAALLAILIRDVKIIFIPSILWGSIFF